VLQVEELQGNLNMGKGTKMKRVLRAILILSLVVIGLMGASSIALADAPPPAVGEPFLCPVVGDGVNHASDVNNDNGVSAINPPVGTSFIPGHNQAGLHVNDHALNTHGPGNPDAGPGGNSEFSPIWPHHGD
jgi:hypothetical protein